MHIAKPRRYPHPASSKRCFTGDKANSSSVSACLDHESVAAPSHQLSSARARGQFKREDNNVLSHDHSIRNEPQHFGKRVELQRPQAQVEFQRKRTAKRSRRSLAAGLRVPPQRRTCRGHRPQRIWCSMQHVAVAALPSSSLSSSSGNPLLLAPHQVTHFSGPSMMFSPMKTPARPRTAPAPPSSDFIKHPAPSPEVRHASRAASPLLSSSSPSLPFLAPPLRLLQIKRARALVVPAHLLKKGGVEQKDDVPRPGERHEEMTATMCH
jgi:hypothetical protein